jgi:hypothetical protein
VIRVKKGLPLRSYRSTRRLRRIARKAKVKSIEGVEVRIRNGDIWFLSERKVCWLPRNMIEARPGDVVLRLMSEGYRLSDKFIDTLLVEINK